MIIDDLDDYCASLVRLDSATRGLSNMLCQDEIWIDGNGLRHDIETMRPSYARNIIKWIMRRADVLYEAACARAALYPGPSGEMAQMAYDEGVNQLFDSDAGEWINEQPLMIALRKLVARDKRPTKEKR